MSEVKFYSNNCPQCMVTKGILKEKDIAFTEVNDMDVITRVASENGIMSMPFAEVNGEIMNLPALRRWIDVHTALEEASSDE